LPAITLICGGKSAKADQNLGSVEEAIERLGATGFYIALDFGYQRV
jgi:hypothetical protein